MTQVSFFFSIRLHTICNDPISYKTIYVTNSYMMRRELCVCITAPCCQFQKYVYPTNVTPFAHIASVTITYNKLSRVLYIPNAFTIDFLSSVFLSPAEKKGDDDKVLVDKITCRCIWNENLYINTYLYFRILIQKMCI